MKKFDVLVIDDESDICETLQTLLDAERYQTLTANSADEAEALLEKYQFSLILCDISMPGRTGLQLISHLRQKGLSSAVVMLTAHSEKEKIIEAMRLGAVDYVTKPFKPDELLTRVLGWTELGRRLQELVSPASESAATNLEQRLRMIELFRLKNNNTAKSSS